MVRSVVVIGSTGSIGRQTVEILAANSEEFDVIGLVCHSNVELLANQARQLNPKWIVSTNNERIDKGCLHGLRTVTYPDMPNERVDVIIVAASGFAGVKLALSSIRRCKVLGLANKESIVCAWHILQKEAKAQNVEIVPIDSELSSLMRSIEGKDMRQVRKLIITASGGPFLGYSKNELFSVSPEQAAAHPVWKMGQKISIDSATMMNKAMEMLGAANIFGTKNIKVLIHQEAMVHSMLEFTDGFLLVGMSAPNMKLYIASALFWPECGKGDDDVQFVPNDMRFSEIDIEMFPAIRIAEQVMSLPNSAFIAMNALNEVAVDSFVHKKIKFTEIAEIVEDCLNEIGDKMGFCNIDSIEDVLYHDHTARLLASRAIERVVL